MFEVRADEPSYAKLTDKETDKVNRYGNPIEFIPLEDTLSLKVNHEDVIGDRKVAPAR